MKLTLIDSDKNVMAEFKVEVDKYMFVITPKIFNDEFSYLHYKLMKLRAKYMTVYLYYIEYDKSEYEARVIEHDIMDELKELLEEEIKYKFVMENKEYFIVED